MLTSLFSFFYVTGVYAKYKPISWAPVAEQMPLPVEWHGKKG